jgi:hypothetical protein
MAWAIDTQQLYIGSGSVSEGAPAVSNVKVLTQNDLAAQGSLIGSIQYVYKVNDTTITTGASANSPVSRYLQSRLDDDVTTSDFGTIGDGAADDTIALQRAINQLFLNPTTPANASSNAGVSKRVILKIPAGVFKISSTIYIPSYASLIGAGADKTTIVFDPSFTIVGQSATSSNVITTTAATAAMVGATITGTGIPANTIISSVIVGTSLTISAAATANGTGVNFTIILPIPAVQFVNDSSTISSPSPLSATTGTTQPRNIRISGLTISTPTGLTPAMQLDAVRDSLFDNLSIESYTSSGTVYHALNQGIFMQALSSIVTCERNIFRNITFISCAYAVFAKQDIRNNIFEDCYFTDAYQGFALGVGANASSTGQQYGPRETEIINCKFYNVKRHAVYLELGYGNITRDCKYDNVGCNGGGNVTAQYPQVYYKTPGNTSQNDYSDRPNDLSTSNLSTPYIPEVAGHASYTLTGVRQVGISYVTTNSTFAFRLPCSTDQYGVPSGSVTYTIEYFYKSATNAFTRKGTMVIAADIDAAKIQLSDEFNFAGTDAGGTNALALDFTASFYDSTNTIYTGSVGQSPYTIGINYTNTLNSDTGTLTYSYTTSL